MNTILDRTTVQDLLDESQEQDTHKADYTAPAKEFNFDLNSRIVPPVSGDASALFGANAASTPLSPTSWAWSQIFTKLGPTVFGKGSNKGLPADYLLALDPAQRAALLNDHIGRADTDWRVRAYDDNARAVLSDIYTTIGNTDLLDILNTVSLESKTENSTTRDSNVRPDSLNVRTIWKNVTTGSDSRGNGSWGIGTTIRNGETGNRKGGVLPLIQRHSCQNSIVVDDTKSGGFEFLHLGSKAAKLVLVKAAIAEALPFAASILNKMIEADNEEIPDFTDVIGGLCKKYGWDDEVKVKIVQGTEGRDTRAGLVNGVTWVAHSIADPDKALDFQIAGGAILLAPGSLFHAAAYAYRNEK